MGLLNKILKKDEKGSKETKTPEKVADVKVEEVEKKVPKAKVRAKSASSKTTKKNEDERAYKLVAYPLITEKATDLAQMNKYVFVVPPEVNRNEIAKTITNIYGVTPIKVNIIKKSGKKVRYGRRFGKTKDFKKAIVTLRSEDRIEVYEGV